MDRLADESGLRVGVITRNITEHPVETLEILYRREGFDPARLAFLVHLPLSADKRDAFREIRAHYTINPARAYACGDEAKDYRAAVGAGIQPFMVSYGFEDYERLTVRHSIPAEVIARSPEELAARVLHALGLPPR